METIILILNDTNLSIEDKFCLLKGNMKQSELNKILQYLKNNRKISGIQFWGINLSKIGTLVNFGRIMKNLVFVDNKLTTDQLNQLLLSLLQSDEEKGKFSLCFNDN